MANYTSLLTMLQTMGSTLTAYDGATPPTNPLATQASKLHADGNQPGYSLNGAQFGTVNPQYQSYQDGAVNPLPLPSSLDLNGVTPSQYINNLPQ
jgi:hypothetical protein